MPESYEIEIWAEGVGQKHINNLALARQFALTAVKLQMFVWYPIRTCFFVSRPRLDGTDGSTSFIVAQEQLFSYSSSIYLYGRLQ